ncbi:zeta toxin family protein [Clavibacter capsici]|uniref:UDP-N-acetylglucosamine kinase n=1 Tax=Clavibacter capsici TaxID=1874630 RepID=A0AAE6XTE5_9MICO|nr:zeta toxin family protein [Clavibacter capsici]ALD13722.1 toxin component of a toxin/antitoxin system [Clavibacter capsici]QIS45947.1 AAA family ATPase [Clavibacter capsici]
MHAVGGIDHLTVLRQLSREGGPLAPDARSASTENPAWYRAGRPTATRAVMHERLMSDAEASMPELGTDRRAVVLAGPPGAGKTSTRERALGHEATRFLVVDADEFKGRLLREAIADGSYESWIKPAAVREREAAGERFHPMELSSLVHAESSYLADEQRARALRAGKNVVIDTVLSSDTKARRIMGELERAGYDVQVIDVEVPREVSEERIRKRWREGNERADMGEGLGGRWVPSEFGAWVYGEPGGRSRPEANARMVAEESPAVSRYRVYWKTAEQEREDPRAPATLETDMTRAIRGGPLVPTRSVPAADVPQARPLPGITRAGRTAPGRAGPVRVDRGR